MTDKCLGFFPLNCIRDLFSGIWMVWLALSPHSAGFESRVSLCDLHGLPISTW